MTRTLMMVVTALLLASPAAVAAQDGGSARAPAVQAVPVFTAAEAPPAAAGLPQRAAAERTMRGYWHLFIAFAVTWLLLFGYAISLGRRFGKLERQLERAGE
jgi:CcmD family protein